jgi:protoporphyrinogen oxidase
MVQKIIIIGAGPAGVSCGYELSKAGYAVDVFEASSYIGGMARSFDLWGQRVDVGPHRFFSKDKKINSFFSNLIKDDYTLVNRLTRIYYLNTFFNYPIKLFNVLTNLPFITIFQILWEYIKVQISPNKNPKTFEEWVTNKFGKKLFQIFFKNYSEKLWGIPCSKIDATWAAQRIKSLSLWEAVKSALIGNVGNKHKTLVDQFAYPNNGTGTIYELAAKFIQENGGQVYLNEPVKKVIQDVQGKVIGIELLNGAIHYADAVVSTMPLTILMEGLVNTPIEILDASRKLYFRSTQRLWFY